MHTDPRLSAPSTHPAGRFLRKALAVAAATVVLVASLAFSMVVFACLLTIGLVVAARIWWTTRHLRRELRERGAFSTERAGADGRVIEGEAVRER